MVGSTPSHAYETIAQPVPDRRLASTVYVYLLCSLPVEHMSYSRHNARTVPPKGVASDGGIIYVIIDTVVQKFPISRILTM